MISLFSVVALLLALPWADAFTTTFAVSGSSSRRAAPFLVLSSSTDDSTPPTDSYDQWYEDFNPSEFEQDTRGSGGNSFDRNNDGGGGWSGGGRNFGGGGGGGYGNRRGGGGGRRDQGGFIQGGSEYTRDTSRDQSNVDEAAVYALLEDRIQAKRRRDFDEADAIRDFLLDEHAVAVFDRERTWRTGASRSGSGMGRGRGGYGRGQQGGRGGGRRERDWGPNGHDYDPSSDAGPNSSDLEESEIHAIIAERLQAKLNRNYDHADRLQRELVEQGIYVHDGMKEWRADGVPYGDIRSGRGRDGGDGRPGRTSGSWSDRNRPYEKSQYSEEVVGDVSDDEIAQLIEQRSGYKVSRDYVNADAIRDQLRDEYNVEVDDRIREWSVGGNFGSTYNEQRQLSQAMKNRGYVKSDYSADVSSPADAEYIQAKVDERVEARKVRDFDTADDIRQELLEDFDVVINDKVRKWSVAGGFGDEAPKRPGGYTRRGGGNLSKEEESRIATMIKERFQAKKNRDFYTADEIRDELRDTYQVSIDDRSKEWRVESDDYVQSAVGQGSRVLSDEEIEIVQSKVTERAVCRRERNYDDADAIRDELMDTFSVLIDDRTKEWRTASDDDSFARDSMKSQQSPYKNKQQQIEDEEWY